MAFAASSTFAMRLAVSGLALGVVTACSDLDYDMRDTFGAGLDTSSAAKEAIADRPSPDKRGIISYPNYQIAVARRGDTLNDVATRIGMPVQDLAKYNGIRPEDTLNKGEVIALPYRVAEPSAATGGSGVVTPPSDVDITALAGGAINSSSTSAPKVDSEPLQPAPKNAPKGETGFEPIRHKVKRGETAFTISRLYNVTPRALADWNGLNSEFTIRENQILLIPPVTASKSANSGAAAASTTVPGQGSPTPTPPSSTTPLPPADAAVIVPKAPDLGNQQTKSTSQMGYPVDGKIIRPYSKGKNNGVDISAPAGSTVKAASDGKVAAITTDADNVKIVVVRHEGNLMTVYYNVDQVKVAKGTTVKRGQALAKVPSKDNFVHFEVRKGFDSVDPMPYLK
ncbi:Murein DD-endopeptidase MepM and murein hydrolase activator NlpD, contain LysM domain [Shimia gijangensis]|uniref:Murein DD-endopeptidase MepM and murein hydrolase activator NlpD, contain LysM domain n=1 Tax=Shimia gijangensis TaxID=1470563 RepID=A0A1M6L827_9RHOB|nr:peptidoglycan DD-metalloendopeptidase family protein [Shimia gijangensis]SHJ67340.1 Murein DD-endopeptidase MepM and murein hydrolase activator NlpD, contain LysM domain [Shimia gijangensis]